SRLLIFLVVAIVGAGIVRRALIKKPVRPDHSKAPVAEVADGPPAPEPKPDRGTPQVWVVAIGIDQYTDDAIPPCHGAVHDARAVAHWFERTAGWGGRNVLVLDDEGQPQPGSDSGAKVLPTRANLDWAFKEWLARRVRPRDVIVVYFAGQAVALP